MMIIKKILCKLFGHKFVSYHNLPFFCERCGRNLLSKYNNMSIEEFMKGCDKLYDEKIGERRF